MATRPDPGERTAWTVVLDVASLAVVVALAVAVGLGVDGPGRVLLALLFTLYVPGRAVVANWPEMRARSEIALPVVFSLALLTLTSTVALWLHAWQPMALFGLAAAGSAAGLLLAVGRHAGWTGRIRARGRRAARSGRVG